MKSPCVEICRFDGPTGWCLACGRTLAECREWKRANHARLKALAAQLPQRLRKLEQRGVRVRPAQDPA